MDNATTATFSNYSDIIGQNKSSEIIRSFSVLLRFSGLAAEPMTTSQRKNKRTPVRANSAPSEANEMYHDLKKLFPQHLWEKMKQIWSRTQINFFFQNFVNSVNPGELKASEEGEHSLLLESFNQWMHDNVTRGNKFTTEQLREKLERMGIKTINSIEKMSLEHKTKKKKGKSILSHSDSNSDSRSAPAAAAASHIIDLTTHDGPVDVSSQSQSSSTANDDEVLAESTNDDTDTANAATNGDTVDVASDDVVGVSPHPQSVLKSECSQSDEHSSPLDTQVMIIIGCRP